MSPSAIINDGNVVVAPDVNGCKPKSTPTSVLHRSLHLDPLQCASASGFYLTLSTGQRILDATGGAAVSCLGHAHPRVLAKMTAQLSQVTYCHSLTFSTPVAEDLATELIAGTDHQMSRAFIVSSGSEAMEAAMKMARQYFIELEGPATPRINFIARRESYHGTTLGALSMSGHVARRALFEPLLMHNVSRVNACNAYRGQRVGEDDAAYIARLAQELDNEFARVGAGSVCAFVAEPVVGAALGCVPAVPGYFAAMRKVCDKHGALLILDEVMSGMGRTGSLHAWQQESVVPDIETIGKGLGGGYAPIAGLLVNKKVVDALAGGSGAFSHGQTYQGHPLACAAALEVQRVIREERLVENVQRMGRLLESLLRRGLETHKYVGDIRGRGLFWGIEFVKDKATKAPFDPRRGVAMAVHELGLRPEYSISLYPGSGTVDGKAGDHILIAPAYNVGEEDIERIADLTCRVIKDYFNILHVQETP